MSESRFRGTERYIATDDLMMAVNAAVTLGRPLLVKGEPGTGKTQLAEEVALALNRPFIQWHIKSTIKAQQGVVRVRRRFSAARFATGRGASA
jgi:MoxR-like ATPase